MENNIPKGLSSTVVIMAELLKSAVSWLFSFGLNGLGCWLLIVCENGPPGFWSGLHFKSGVLLLFSYMEKNRSQYLHVTFLFIVSLAAPDKNRTQFV